MKQLIEFTMDNGETVWVEVEGTEPKRGEREVSRKDLPQKATKTFQNALKTVKPISEAILNKFSQLSESPKEIEVEFGLKMSVEAGAVIACTGFEANFKVKLKWTKE